MLLPREFLNGVVAIGTDDSDGQRNWIASGVHVNEVEGELRSPFLVTNKHVIEGLESMYVRLNPTANGPALETEVSLRDDTEGQYWYPHPDPDVDIAITPLMPEFFDNNPVDTFFYEVPDTAWELSHLRDHDVSEGDQIYVLGFPMGIVGDERSRVIARGGTIARLQDALAGASNSFLVDASVYPGNSGGAVVLRPEAPVGEAVEEARLIGIVAAYVPYRDMAVSAQTGRPRVIFEENSGLARVYPLDYITEIAASVPYADEPPAPVEQVPADEIDTSISPRR